VPQRRLAGTEPGSNAADIGLRETMETIVMAASITLPKEPDGNQFEDFVAASLRSLGYFVETRVTLRDGKKEVLELDVVATPSGGSALDRELYEAKKGTPSFPDMFKLFGQRIYLGIDHACLATLGEAEPQHKPIYDAKGAELNVRPCCHKLDFSQLAGLAPPRNNLNEQQRQMVAAIAWYLQIAKRLAQAAQAEMCNANKGVMPYDDLRRYAFEVHASFFAQTPLNRAETLYAAYFAHPKLAGDLVNEIASKENVSAKDVWNQVNDTHERLWLQSQMQAEGVARVAIIKHAMDHVASTGGAPLPTFTLKIGGTSHTVVAYSLPPRFITGLGTLHKHPHSLRLPYLYQSFLELCGGFLFTKSGEDLGLLEALTGVPKDEVLPALLLLDEFFAPSGGSMFYSVKGELLCLKMVPGFVRAIGSILRQKFFGFEDYDQQYPGLGWLLRKWHAAGYTVLAQELPQVQAAPSAVAQK